MSFVAANEYSPCTPANSTAMGCAWFDIDNGKLRRITNDAGGINIWNVCTLDSRMACNPPSGTDMWWITAFGVMRKTQITGGWWSTNIWPWL